VVPPVPAAIRDSVRSRLAAEGAPALHAELKQRDPAAAARLSPGDRARVTRALEVVLATGRSLLDWHDAGNPATIDLNRVAKIFLNPDREALFARIDARFESMMAAGALEEVRALAARHLDPMLPAMKAHGVPWLVRHLDGDIPLDEAAAGAIMDTRRYAKRQVTWFRNQMTDWPSVPAERAAAEIERQLTLAAGGQTNTGGPG
jgi:tRNA dimethylallyltransferase